MEMEWGVTAGERWATDAGRGGEASAEMYGAGREVVDGTQAYKGLGDVIDRDRAHDPNFEPSVRLGGQHPAQHQTVDDRSHHSDVVGFGSFDAPLSAQVASKDVTAPNNNADLGSLTVDVEDLVGNVF